MQLTEDWPEARVPTHRLLCECRRCRRTRDDLYVERLADRSLSTALRHAQDEWEDEASEAFESILLEASPKKGIRNVKSKAMPSSARPVKQLGASKPTPRASSGSKPRRSDPPMTKRGVHTSPPPIKSATAPIAVKPRPTGAPPTAIKSGQQTVAGWNYNWSAPASVADFLKRPATEITKAGNHLYRFVDTDGNPLYYGMAPGNKGVGHRVRRHARQADRVSGSIDSKKDSEQVQLAKLIKKIGKNNVYIQAGDFTPPSGFDGTFDKNDPKHIHLAEMILQSNNATKPQAYRGDVWTFEEDADDR